MENSRLIKTQFEEFIHQYSLCFKDSELEEAFIQSKLNLELLTKSSKIFLILIVVGYLTVYGFDISLALLFTENYSEDTSELAVYSLFAPIFILESIFYFCPRFSEYRGIPWTILGCLITVERNLAFFASETFYPNFGEE